MEITEKAPTLTHELVLFWKWKAIHILMQVIIWKIIKFPDIISLSNKEILIL